MNNYNTLFDELFADYSALNPSVKSIHSLFASKGETIINDHIAFRTFNFPSINVDVLARPFIFEGYIEKGHYRFEEKKLTAKHYEHKDDKLAPKVFISQLMTEEFSENTQLLLQQHVNEKISSIPEGLLLLKSGCLWGQPDFNVYESLLKESEYAAWLYTFGFRANHFTVFINHLKQFKTIGAVNEFLKTNGYQMNTSGGEIKGSAQQLLEQSSTLADRVSVDFKQGKKVIPACYYEFALRYKDDSEELFNGFIAKSADKIFESTNRQE